MLLHLVLCGRFRTIWSSVLGLFSAIRNKRIFVKLNLSMFSLLIKTREKSQKYFSLSAISQNSIHSNPSSTLGTTIFQTWIIFLAHPVVLPKSRWRKDVFSCKVSISHQSIVKQASIERSQRAGFEHWEEFKHWGTKRVFSPLGITQHFFQVILTTI